MILLLSHSNKGIVDMWSVGSSTTLLVSNISNTIHANVSVWAFEDQRNSGLPITAENVISRAVNISLLNFICSYIAKMF